MICGTYHGLVISDQNPCSNGKKMDHDGSHRDCPNKNKIQGKRTKMTSQVLFGNYLGPTWNNQIVTSLQINRKII